MEKIISSRPFSANPSRTYIVAVIVMMGMAAVHIFTVSHYFRPARLDCRRVEGAFIISRLFLQVLLDKVCCFITRKRHAGERAVRDFLMTPRSNFKSERQRRMRGFLQVDGCVWCVRVKRQNSPYDESHLTSVHVRTCIVARLLTCVSTTHVYSTSFITKYPSN